MPNHDGRKFDMSENEARELISRITPGAFLRKLREEYGFSLSYLAQAIGVKKWTVTSYQAGRHPMPERRIDNLLGEIVERK